MKVKKIFALLLFSVVTVQAFAGGELEPKNTPDGVGGIVYYNGLKSVQEVPPSTGFHISFKHGPNSTMAVYTREAGKARSIKVNVNRHGEETGMIIKGSMLFKAGYNGEFERVLRTGDVIIIPKCVPHSGISGWDANEETILVTFFVDKYTEYGPDDTGKIPPELAKKVNSPPGSGVSETEECRKMKSPPVTWSRSDLPIPPPVPMQ